MTPERYQRLIVWLAVLYLYFFMLLAAVSFATSPSRTVFLTFQDNVHVALTPELFSALSFLSVLLVPFQLFRRMRFLSTWKRRLWYILSAAPLFAYTIPVAITVYVMGTSGVTVTVYIAICLSFVIISLATFRPKEALPE